MLKKILTLLMVLACYRGAAQMVLPVPPTVSVADLEATTHPKDTTAGAAYLYRYGRTFFELNNGYWIMVTEVYTRIKIYKKDSYGYATPEMVFYSGTKKAKGNFSKAAAYNLENGKVVKTELKKESEFEETHGEHTRKTLALPNVKEGTVIEYTTTIKTPYFSTLRDWYFQYGIPVNDVQYYVYVPHYFQYNIYKVGYVEVDVVPSIMVNDPKTGNKVTVSAYLAKDVPAFKEEAFVNNPENYIGKLMHELAMVAIPGTPVQTLSGDWVSVAKKIYEHESFGRELNFEGYFKEEVKPLLAGLEGDEAKMKAIFSFVQNRMAWNEEEGYMCDKGVKDAYKNRQGNAADINLMLTAILRYADLDANPVLVSTLDNGIALFASRTAYNYVVCAVKLGDKTILLDATSKFTKPGMLPPRALNWIGRLIKKNGETEEISLMPQTHSREAITVLANIGTDGVVSGKARDIYLDIGAYSFREVFAKMKEDVYIEGLEKQYKGLQVDNFKVTGQSELDKPLTEEYDFAHNNVSDVIGNKIYVTPLLFFTRAEMPFKEETREYPVDFMYPHENKFSISLIMPAGYVLESLPKPLTVSMQDGIASFKYITAASGNTIQIQAVLSINDASVSKEYYAALREFFQKMVEKQNEKIVLVKG